MIEGVDTEFKELDRMKGTLPDSIPKEIVAFANTEVGSCMSVFAMTAAWSV